MRTRCAHGLALCARSLDDFLDGSAAAAAVACPPPPTPKIMRVRTSANEYCIRVYIHVNMYYVYLVVECLVCVMWTYRRSKLGELTRKFSGKAFRPLLFRRLRRAEDVPSAEEKVTEGGGERKENKQEKMWVLRYSLVSSCFVEWLCFRMPVSGYSRI